MVSVCWQSRLDLHPISIFLSISWSMEITACLEAFTVLENIIENLNSDENLSDLKKKIKSAKSENPETQPLIAETEKVLKEH